MANNRNKQFKGAAPVTDKTTADTQTQEAQSQEASLKAEQTGDATEQPQETQAPATEAAQEAQPEATQAPEATPEPTQAPEPVATEAPVVQATQAPVAEGAAEAALTRLQERLADDLTKTEKIVRDTVQQYLDDLKPGRPAQAEVINRSQLMLWRLILRVVETPDDTEFEKSLTLLIEYFRAHRKGALGEYYVFRGMDTITLDQDTTAAFQRALNLLIIGATAASLKEVSRFADLGRSLPEGVYSDNARNRLLGYLS